MFLPGSLLHSYCTPCCSFNKPDSWCLHLLLLPFGRLFPQAPSFTFFRSLLNHYLLIQAFPIWEFKIAAPTLPLCLLNFSPQQNISKMFTTIYFIAYSLLSLMKSLLNPPKPKRISSIKQQILLSDWICEMNINEYPM